MNSPSMYRAMMGDAFLRLAAPVRQFHSCAGRHVFHGEVRVDAPASRAARWLAMLLGAPLNATRGPLRFELLAEADTETWTRFFPGQTMRSTLTKNGNRMTERVGAARLTFSLLELGGALEMQLEKLHFCGIACPRWLMPHVLARETGEGRRLHFRIQASLPLIGRVASYAGYLEMPERETP